MRSLAQRVQKMERETQVRKHAEPTHYCGLDLDLADDDELEALAVVAKAVEAAAPETVIVADGSDELRAAVEFLTPRGAVFPSSVIVATVLCNL